MSEVYPYTVCLGCERPVTSFPSRWCNECCYPGIDEDYQEYINLVEDGHRPCEAAVLSGWKGTEEINE